MERIPVGQIASDIGIGPASLWIQGMGMVLHDRLVPRDPRHDAFATAAETGQIMEHDPAAYDDVVVG